MDLNKYIRVALASSDTEKEKIQGDLFVKGFTNVESQKTASGYEILLFPGTFDDLESILDHLIVNGFRDAKIIG